MATVERVQGPSVQQDPLPNVRATAGMTGRETAGLQRGLGDVQQVVTALGQQAQDKADTASLLEAQRKLGDYERTWFDPNNPDSVPNTKGKATMGLVERIDPDYEKMVSELSGSLRSDRAREAFSKHAAGSRESLLGRVNNYAVGETDKYVQAEFAAGVTNATERAAQAALEGRIDDQVREVQNGLNIIGSQAKINGEPPEATSVRKQAFLSTVHATAVNGMLASGDVAGAGAYFHDNADDISAEVAGQLMARMRPMQLEYNAETIADGIESGRLSPSGQGIDSSVDQVWAAQIKQESGGRQTDDKGVPITSSKGAIGVAQVMPATGPIAAQYAGVPWDPERFKTDKAYNEQIGKAYMQAQVDQFGSVPLGLAAYNAGPGAVQKWIVRFGDPRKGEISIDEFVSRIPYPETKDYVVGIMARSGRAVAAPGAAGAPAPLPANATLEDKIDRARSIPDIYQRRQVEQVLRQRHALRKQAESENEAAVLEKVNMAVYAAPIGTPFTKVPGLTPADIAFVTQKGHRDNYERIIQQRIEGSLPRTNEVVFDTLRRQSVEDPEGFAKQKNWILANSHQFATADYETLLSRVAAITDPKKGGERADWATEEQRVSNINRELGIPTTGNKGADQRAAVARSYMEAEREFVQRNNGAKPTPEQRDALAAQVKRNLAEARANGVDIAKRSASAATFDVTPATRQRAIARLRTQNGGREPTEAELVEYLSAATLIRTPR